MELPVGVGADGVSDVGVAGVKVAVMDGVFSLVEMCCGNCFVLDREPGLVMVELLLDDDLRRGWDGVFFSDFVTDRF